MTAPRARLRFLPAILWLAVIFFLSSQTGEQTAASASPSRAGSRAFSPAFR